MNSSPPLSFKNWITDPKRSSNSSLTHSSMLAFSSCSPRGFCMRRIPIVKKKSNRRLSLPKRGKGFCMGRILIVKKKSNRRVRRRQGSWKKAAERELSLALGDLAAELELSLAMGDLSLYADKYFFDVDGVNPTNNLIGTPYLIGTPDFFSHDNDNREEGLKATNSTDMDDSLAAFSVDECGGTCSVDFDRGVNPNLNLIGTPYLIGSPNFIATPTFFPHHFPHHFPVDFDRGVNPGVNLIGTPNLIGAPNFIATPTFFSHDFHSADLILGSKDFHPAELELSHIPVELDDLPVDECGATWDDVHADLSVDDVLGALSAALSVDECGDDLLAADLILGSKDFHPAELELSHIPQELDDLPVDECGATWDADLSVDDVLAALSVALSVDECGDDLPGLLV